MYKKFTNIMSCQSNSKTLCNDENCVRCYEKSFSSHPKAKYWSNKNQLIPRQIFKSSGKKCCFDCNCGHDFIKTINAVKQGSWCPYCSRTPCKLCEDQNCKKCYERSFESHPKAIYWSSKNQLTPRYVFKYSNLKYFFDCPCGHEFECKLSDITYQNHWCQYCGTSPQKLCSNENCNSCFERSFGSHLKAKFWSDKNELTPRQVFKSSDKKCWFVCEKGHEFQSCLESITSKKCWCPLCVNKTETKLFSWLEENNYKFLYQAKFIWCKNKNCFPYDFLFDDFKLILELDGIQHFKQVGKWTSPEETHERDIFKNKKAIENGYSIIRILQEDIFDDKNDWENKLKKYLHSYDKLNCIFINNKDEYDKMREGMEEIRKSEELDFEIQYQ